MNPTVATGLFVALLILVYGGVALLLFRRQKSLRQLQPPEEQTVLRGPGESQRKRAESLLERAMDTILMGASATVILAVVPLMVLRWKPEANVWFLLLSCLALFFAASIWIVGRVLGLLGKRSTARLGWLGERVVAEHLQACGEAGFFLVHDVPAESNGHEFNLDHVAIGQNALVVIETKMRSKPADREGHEIKVEFDGKRLSWLRFRDDTKSVWQVQSAAKWLGNFVSKECGIEVPVKTVIAIPGWRVVEKKLTQPRVVSGKGVTDAVIQAATTGADRFGSLSQAEIDQIREALEFLCRDVEY